MVFCFWGVLQQMEEWKTLATMKIPKKISLLGP
jgi:hypothetical protein